MSKNILICDDEIHILRAVEFKLQRAGFAVRCAGDGEEAWELIQQQCPDIVVTDCQMPRLDGIGLTERLRSEPATADLPVVMLTAKGYELSHDDLSNRLKVAAVLAKPFSPRGLLKCVEQVLETGKYEAPPVSI